MEKIKQNHSMQLSAILLSVCILAESITPGIVCAAEWLDKGYHLKPISKVYGELVDFEDTVLIKKSIDEVERIPGGPDQPEVQSFTPIGTSDMVDPFTGDFSYNIPLMEVDGYPINIAYNAGVTMDQEATWVGLGWNLNPGVVNRSMRGIPDDFNGTDKITKTFNQKPDWTAGTSVGANFELFAFDLENISPSGGINASIGINYNNYNGFGADVSVGTSFSLSKGDNKFSAGLGISGSSQSGASLSPSLSFSNKKAKDENTSISNGINIGTSYNSRGGLSNVTVGYTRSYSNTVRYKNVNLKNQNGTNSISTGASSSFNTGMATYTPSISFPMNSFGITGRFKLGPDAVGSDVHVSFSGYYRRKWLKYNSLSSPAYGYLNLQNGQGNEKAMLDFNRENDGVFTKNTPALPIPNLTYDIFSVSGQGVGGSYRLYRPDIGYVFDPTVKSGSVSASVGAEVGMGATFKAGVDVSLVATQAKSGAWNDGSNSVSNKLKFKHSDVTFREANELSVDNDPGHFENIGADQAVRFLNPYYSSLRHALVTQNGSFIGNTTNFTKLGKEKRNQVIYTLSNYELYRGLGVDAIHPKSYPTDNIEEVSHHIGQFTTLNTDGTRYVYGIPAYSHVQENVSFAVGGLSENCTNGQVTYDSGDDSVGNSKGIDNHYNSVLTPPFAHSYLLTSVLNADYIDADDIKGPSKGDLGGYIRFSYKKIDEYKWKNPVNDRQAYFDEGLNSLTEDNKAHYIYGEKELWYVDTIVTKNHIALFYTSNRNDGYSVEGRNGSFQINNSTVSMQKLDSIALFSLPEFEENQEDAIPLKVVHFEYDYSLCGSYDLNVVNSDLGSGKLTLKKIYFTYQQSNKGRYSPYIFEYGYNPNYNLKSTDRWGCYKEKPVECGGGIEEKPLRPSDYPYVGYDKSNVDEWVSAWSLSIIHLPSGGRIEVDYESDDYAYVQHKQANQMFKIIGVEGEGTDGIQKISRINDPNKALLFEMIPETLIQDYGSVGDRVYFRALMDFNDPLAVVLNNGRYDFVPGYAEIEEISQVNSSIGKIKLKSVLLDEKFPNSSVNPITMATIQFGRLHLSKVIPPSSQSEIGETGLLDILTALGGAFTSFGELITGPNLPLWNKGIGKKIVVDRSWVRLKNPNNKKLGGGHRVKEIRMYDAWDQMTDSGTESYYGQVYDYTLKDGGSSGVASYEPQLGGDENVWRQPIANNVKYLLAPDSRNYQETPFGEQFFPGPRVGYSRVEIRDIPRSGVSRTATGKVVHEFYTAKDFPTITKRTSPGIKRDKSKLFALFFSMSIDKMSASQGFVVENNDMHGKPKAQMVYAEGQTEPITKVEYFYQSEPIVVDGIAARHLINTVTSINREGMLSESTVGRTYEAVADFRKSSSQMESGSINVNLNYTIPFVFVPMVLGSGSYEKTEFKSASFTKIIERKGILSKTKGTDLGSVVETNNLAYDAETGAVLLTQTTTDFNDKVYNFTYPAHWYYEGMGQAYKNVGAATGVLSFSNGIANVNFGHAFYVGDELALVNNANYQVGWIVETSPTTIKVLLKDGSLMNGPITFGKVLRSGRRNMQNTPIGTIALRTNPLEGLPGNIFDKVLQAGAVEYEDEWRTFCECFLDESSENYTTNPYVLGLKGTWRPKASYVHLSGRTQAFENNNSNIREDGVFTSFTPFYKLQGNEWGIDKQNWTYTSSVTEFSPFGQALETVDALDRYSSSMFGYNQSLPIAVAANTRYRQLGFDGFEDYDYINCSDNHFKIGENAEIVEGISHTGRRSVKVTEGNPVEFKNTFALECEDSGCNLNVTESILIEEECLKCPVEEVTEGYTMNTFHVNSGIGPFTFDYNVIIGTEEDIEFILEDNAFSVVNYSRFPILVEVTITDANGCTETFEVSTVEEIEVVEEPCGIVLSYSSLTTHTDSPQGPPNTRTTHKITASEPVNFTFQNVLGNNIQVTQDASENSITFSSEDNNIHVIVTATNELGCTETYEVFESASPLCDLSLDPNSTFIGWVDQDLGPDPVSGDWTHTFNSLGGTPPVNISYDIISENHDFTITNNEGELIVNTGTYPIHIEVTATDNEGCSDQLVLNNFETVCNLVIKSFSEETLSGGAYDSFSVLNGLAPYTFEFILHSGDPIVETTSNSISFDSNNNGIVRATITVTDERGCTETIELNNN